MVRAWVCLCVPEAYGDAVAALQPAVALRPDAIGARCNLAEALFELGHVDAAVAEYREAAKAGDPRCKPSHWARSPASHPVPEPGPRGDPIGARAAGLRRSGAASVPSGARRPSRHASRIGYVSAFFGARNWMKPVWGVINRHDRDRFEVHLLSDGADPSASSGYADHPEDRIWRIGKSQTPSLHAACARSGWMS